MQLNHRMFCKMNEVRSFNEERLLRANGKRWTLSIVNEEKNAELSIFIDKDDCNDCYEVRVYKFNLADKYIPNDNDKAIAFMDCSNFVAFFFKDFADSVDFVATIETLHPEFKERPFLRI